MTTIGTATITITPSPTEEDALKLFAETYYLLKVTGASTHTLDKYIQDVVKSSKKPEAPKEKRYSIKFRNERGDLVPSAVFYKTYDTIVEAREDIKSRGYNPDLYTFIHRNT